MIKRGRKKYGCSADERNIIKLIICKRKRRKGSIGPTAYNRIAVELNAEGHRTRDGKLWRAKQIRDILNELPLLNVKKRPKKTHLASDDYLELGQIHDVLAACREGVERVIIETLFGTGLRASELAGLQIRDVNLAKNLVDVRKGKGNKQGVVKICQRLTDMLADYIKKRKKAGAGRLDSLFLNRAYKPIRYWDIYYLVKAVGKRASVTLHPHALRHTHGDILYNYLNEEILTKSQLRHSRLETTTIYANPRDFKKLKTIEKFDLILTGKIQPDLLPENASIQVKPLQSTDIQAVNSAK